MHWKHCSSGLPERQGHWRYDDSFKCPVICDSMMEIAADIGRDQEATCVSLGKADFTVKPTSFTPASCQQMLTSGTAWAPDP